jgi:hypothetical protein
MQCSFDQLVYRIFTEMLSLSILCIFLEVLAVQGINFLVIGISERNIS